MFIVEALKRTARHVRRRVMPEDLSSGEFRRAAQALRPGDVAIDCGANVGLYTAMMARSGATVHAFEPDPVAFAALERRLTNTANVTLHNAAASDHDGRAKLYFHTDRAADPVARSQSSSLDARKTNVDDRNYSEVALVDFAAFVGRIGKVKLLKMDVEGHEVEIINHLIDQDRVSGIEQAFVELHDRKNPALKPATDALRGRIVALSLPFDLTWH